MARETKSGETKNGRASPRNHGDLLSGGLLAFLRNYTAHGYELRQRLAEAGLPAFDSGTIYRTLRQLEESGLVSSFWDMSPSGPARRMYSLTKAGDAFLSGWLNVLRHYEKVAESALAERERSVPIRERPAKPKRQQRKTRRQPRDGAGSAGS